VIKDQDANKGNGNSSSLLPLKIVIGELEKPSNLKI
jgi:hypothetical protein